MELNLLTLNVHGWAEEDQLKKIDILAEAIAQNRYDIIAMQEVNQPKDKPFIDKTNTIREGNYGLALLSALEKKGMTDYTLEWAFSHYSFGIYEEGVAFLTRHSVKAKEQFFISKNKVAENYKTRVIQKLTLAIAEKEIDVFTCHLGWWHDEEDPAEQQLQALLKEVDTRSTSFLMGDFNNDASLAGEGYDYLLKHGLKDTWNLATKRSGEATIRGKIAGWNNNRGDLRIDYIFAQGNIDVPSHHVIFDGENRPVVSDHFGVECTVTLK
ncbi:endonuclease/exonuclease/phosphatase family protein [Shouchella patagoniensis]|uniref:endonuclease/exonuclease/phosphatase family protein n=1 Tax=Shouchella patagoniensis TaxID=228576 RepID=UPI000995836B|nr:endonuclease/exonuclease/phosphatase family protein [Shouchella patagoniensis]